MRRQAHNPAPLQLETMRASLLKHLRCPDCAGLMRLCRMLSPVVYVTCTLPSRHFRWAARFPYRHGPHAFGIVGDLYDRLSAPIEKRYSRDSAAALAAGAGLTVVTVAQQRGWMVRAVKS